jgi:hypothetical protein
MSENSERKVELKYCECCGGLWLRWEGNTQSYCYSCAPHVDQLAVGRKKAPCRVKFMADAGGAVCA